MSEDLYKEVVCRRCGQKKLEIASFCPHCGETVKRSWIETIIRKGLREGEADGSGSKGVTVIPILLGLLIAAYFFYTAIENKSIQGLILALLSLYFAFRSIVSGSKRSPDLKSDDQTVIREEQEGPDDHFPDKFFCENCGTSVSRDATECPKCGMRFGV
jgi:ribosomal protein L40E